MKTSPIDRPNTDELCPKFTLASVFEEIAPRKVRPEILDHLPTDSLDARASRRDLRIINRLFGSSGWFKNALREHVRRGDRIIELGAGDGDLIRYLHASGVDLAGLDLGHSPTGWLDEGKWFQTNVLEFTGWKEFPVVIANLFFHHFDGEQLATIGAQLGHARLVIASEPLRSRRTEWLFSLVCPAIGAHPVTRHDGRVSIAGGFRDDELPRSLGLDPSIWQCTVRETWRGVSQLVAERRP